MPSQVKTTQKAVLEAVLARIRSQVTYAMPGTAAAQSLNETTMFLAWDADQAVAQQPARNNVWGCVVPLQGTPSDAEFMGGGENDLHEQTGVTVMFFTSRKADQAAHSKHTLLDAGALLDMKRLLLKALTGWVPTDGSGNYLLTSPMQPISCAPPNRPQQSDIADLSVTFTTDFEWDLS